MGEEGAEGEDEDDERPRCGILGVLSQDSSFAISVVLDEVMLHNAWQSRTRHITYHGAGPFYQAGLEYLTRSAGGQRDLSLDKGLKAGLRNKAPLIIGLRKDIFLPRSIVEKLMVSGKRALGCLAKLAF